MQSRQRTVWAIFSVFFVESAVLGNWIPRIPDIKNHLGLSDASLGVCLLAIPLGTLLSFLVASRLLAPRGLREGCRLWLPLWALAFLVPGLVNSMSALFIVLFIAGFAVGMCEVAMNTKAHQIETEIHHRIMSRCHGFWSLGSMAGALFGSVFAHWAVPVSTHYLLIMPALAVAGFLAATALPPDLAGQRSAATTGPVFRLPAMAIVLLCVMPIGIMAVEGAFIDWSAVFMRDILDAAPIVTGVTYAFFSIVMAMTRMAGDSLATRYGDRTIVLCSGLAATAGIGLFATAQTTAMAFVGAALSGLGVAIVYPLAMTAAAQRPGRAEDNVAALSLFGFTAFLVTPPVIGWVADTFDLRIALLILVPLAATTPLLSREVSRNRRDH